jgi:CheY-like chemotaxis protein
VDQRQLAAFVDLLPEGAAFVSTNGQVRAANAALADLLGISLEDIVGRDLADGVASAAELRDALARCVERRRAFVQLVPRRQNSRTSAALARAQLFDASASDPLVFLRISGDPAEQSAEQWLTVSHELRAPLNAIVTWAHVLRQGSLDATVAQRALDAIERNAHSQARLLDDLSGLARAGGAPFVRQQRAPELVPPDVVIGAEKPLKRPPIGVGGSDLSGIRVLVVDDDRDTRDSITTLLIENRADACNAGSVREALRSLAERPPHVVVTDLLMPDLDGFSLLRMIRTIEELNAIRIPTIALTALSSEESQRRGLESGFDVYLMKPVKPDELLSIVAAAAQTQAAPSGS